MLGAIVAGGIGMFTGGLILASVVVMALDGL